MKNYEYIIAAGLVLLAWKMWNGTTATAATASSQPGGAVPPSQQTGWQYYSGGVAVDMQGNWYQNGVKLDTNAAHY